MEKQVPTVIEKTRVLIVDDEPSICDILEKFLKKKGYDVSRAGDGKQAVKVIDNGPVDLIVSDIKMPGMSGVELLQKVREKGKNIPVLITTGFPTLDTAIEALKLGAYDYLTKPFHLEEIGEKIYRALAQQKLQEDNILFSKLVSLHEVTKILASTLDPSDLNEKFLGYATRFARADDGALFFCDPQKKLSLARLAQSRLRTDFWLRQAFVHATQWVLDHQEPLVIDRDKNDLPPALKPLPSDVHAFIAFPLKTASHTIGVLNLVRLQERMPFSNLDLELINVLASQASISIENVRLYHNIRDNYLKTIRAFAIAVEAKDLYTSGHSENVMKYAVMIAKHLDLSHAEIERVKYAGLLHDIGKIGVSEYILNKPGKLTPQEFHEIKKHPEIGAKIIADVPFLKSLVPLVLHHHEFYGGGGYPHGIAGEDIPLGARILSVADAYEAMTSDRPYRKSLSQETAFSILDTQRGIQFDPAIVDAFLAVTRPKK
ncbi:MAG: response regulator [Chitinispirillaceae bacterium]|nr:response regulator [Chitinispirillaceae bacterium]